MAIAAVPAAVWPVPGGGGPQCPAGDETLPNPPVGPSILDVGPGDTFDDPIECAGAPYVGAGSTLGYGDDYDALCWQVSSDSPDVVYAYTPDLTGYYRFDLCGSLYDTKLLLFDDSRELIACNDDGYDPGDPCEYTSLLDGIFLAAGTVCYAVVDGYAGDAGDYTLTVTEAEDPCTVSCPAGAIDEAEADPAAGVPDVVNCGCGCSEAPLYTALACDAGGEVAVCLTLGWRAAGDRDSDWFWGNAGADGNVHLEVSGAMNTAIIVYADVDCAAGDAPVGMAESTDCAAATLDVSLSPGAGFLVWVMPAQWGPPHGLTPVAYDAVLTATGLSFPLATDDTTWDAVKAMYR